MTDAAFYLAALAGSAIAVWLAVRLRARARGLRVETDAPVAPAWRRPRVGRGVSLGALGVLALSLGVMALLNMSPANTLWSEELTLNANLTTHPDFNQVLGLCEYSIEYVSGSPVTISGKTVYTKYTYRFVLGAGCQDVSYLKLPSCFDPRTTSPNGMGYYYLSEGIVVGTTQPASWTYGPSTSPKFVKWTKGGVPADGPLDLTFSFTLPGIGHPLVTAEALIHGATGDFVSNVQFPQPLHCTPPPQCDASSLLKVFYGTNGDDTITGTDFNDLIVGYGGNDKLTGGKGNDCLVGGPGNDKLYGGKGNDRLLGEAGDDKLYGEDGNDKLYGGDNTDYCAGGPGSDTIETCEGSSTVNGLQGLSLTSEGNQASSQSMGAPNQSAPASTPTPSPSSPSNNNGPSSQSAIVTPQSIPTSTPVATQTLVPTRTPAPTKTPASTGGTARGVPSRTPSSTRTPTATVTAALTRTATPTATATGTAIPTATATATATPENTQPAVLNRLSWNAAAGAKSYNVYRSELKGGGPEGEYELVGNANKTTFDDVKAVERKTYYYVVTAVDVEDDESDESVELRIDTAERLSVSPTATPVQPQAPSQAPNPTKTPTRTPTPNKNNLPALPIGAPTRVPPRSGAGEIVQPPILPRSSAPGASSASTPIPTKTPIPRR